MIKPVDRFCAKHPGFGIPKLMMWVIIGTAIMFLLIQMDSSGKAVAAIVFVPRLILRGQIWRLVTWVFIPTGDNILFMAISMYFYWFVSKTLEAQWGTAKFNVYYLSGVFLHIVSGFIYGLSMEAALKAHNIASPELSFVPMNAIYLNLSLFFVFAAMYPNMQVLLFFIIPVKMKWLAIVDAAFFLYTVLTTSFPLNLFPLVGVANFLILCGPNLLNQKNIRLPKFRTSYQKIYKQRGSKGGDPFRGNGDSFAERKCAVCGKHAKDYPELEFRFCSRCDGYHCFCEEHINSHVHFTK
jgi:hypothetical protein